MKNKLYKLTLLLFLIPLISMASNPAWNGKYTKEKKIKKEFTVNANALLKLSNSYGNLHITSWNENKTVIEVHIRTNSDNEEKAQKKLDQINVEFQNSSTMVSAETVFSKNNWSWGNSNMSLEINYTVKVPVGNTLDLNNDYGTIYLNETNATVHINCDYGRLELGKLNADNNVLNFDYASKSTIEYMKSGEINANYSSFEIEKVENITIAADYANSEINNAKNVEYTCDYGNFKVNNAINVRGTGDYLITRLGTIHGDVEISSDYGSIKIDELASDAGNVSITSDYINIKIGYNNAYHFNFKIELDYAGMSGDSNFEYTIKREKSTEKYYEGYYGSKNKNNITITSDYGGVSFSKK